MTEQDNMFEDINHISLTESDLLETFLEYMKKDSSYSDLKILNSYQVDGLLEYQDFMQAAIISCRQAVILAMLSLSLEKAITTQEFSKMCEECSNIAGSKFLIKSCLKQLKDSIPDLAFATNDFEGEIKQFFKSFEREIFSNILSRNKDLIEYTKLSHKLINERKALYFDLLEKQYV